MIIYANMYKYAKVVLCDSVAITLIVYTVCIGDTFEFIFSSYCSSKDVDVDGKHGRRQIASMPVSQYNLFKGTID